MTRTCAILAAALTAGIMARAQTDADLRRLCDAYHPMSRSYPAGGSMGLTAGTDGRSIPYAQPDADAWFRWHFYNDQAIERCDDAAMDMVVHPYNPMEGQGVSAERGSGVKVEFVPDNVTEGKTAVRVEFPALAVQTGKAVVAIAATAGPAPFSNYQASRTGMATASTYWPHYRWLKLDAFNPAGAALRVRVAGVPMRVPPGRSVIAVKTADAAGNQDGAIFGAFTVALAGAGPVADPAASAAAPTGSVTLFLDNVRMEQETARDMLFRLHFAARDDEPVLFPGFTCVSTGSLYAAERKYGWTAERTTRSNGAHTFRSHESGITWGHLTSIDAPFRIDAAPGRYGIHIFAAPPAGMDWAKGLTVKVNGQDQVLYAPRDAAAVREMALGGERWDYRPGACVWESLVRQPFYPPTEVLYADAPDGRLLLDLPKGLFLRTMMVFDVKNKEAALRQIGRFNFLLAESWDVSHPLVRSGFAASVNYIGLHDEMTGPETIPARLRAMKFARDDFERGFATFVRGLTEAVYPDTIPSPAEAAAGELAAWAAPGQRTCVTLGLLPLRECRGLTVRVEALKDAGGNELKAGVDIRVSRQHQKTMQFGHHNHAYNYEEHYLVRRDSIDLYPAAARRIYVDLAVPAGAPPGAYSGAVVITGSDGRAARSLPLRLEVVPVTLQDPPVWFAGSFAHPLLKDYGLNCLRTSYDEAAKHGYKGFCCWLYDAAAVSIRGKRIGWSGVLPNKDLLASVVDEGLAGKGPRGFFGGTCAGMYGSTNAEQQAREFFGKVLGELPRMDILTISVPVYGSPKGIYQDPHEWDVFVLRPAAGTTQALAAAAAAGKPFWFADGLRHSKEQAGRFTFGLWLWRSGAAGRYTPLDAALQYGGGTARSTYAWEPYFTLLDVTTCNVYTTVKDSLVPGQYNPSRDLVTIRSGIDDYRYVYTLEQWLARDRLATTPAQAAALDFLKKLREDLSLDLLAYYCTRSGSYGENWYPLPGNTWTTAKFEQVRRAAAGHILAVAGTGSR